LTHRYEKRQVAQHLFISQTP